MKQQFKESFDIIKPFSDVFVKLFGGGKADVEDEEMFLLVVLK